MSKTNENIINSAFERLRARKEAVAKNGLIALMRTALDILVEQHEIHPVAHSHIEDERDTLGWMVFHDGKRVDAATYGDGPIPGNVIKRLWSIGSHTTGWVGILMSEMYYDWYRVDWEINFLTASRDEIRDSFDSIFRKVL